MAVPDITFEGLQLAAQAAQDKHGENIQAVEVGPQIGITDAFLFISAESERQVLAIQDEIEDVLRVQKELKALRREGTTEGRWVLLDFGHFVVHIQHQEERELYALDRLWVDAPQIPLNLANEISA